MQNPSELQQKSIRISTSFIKPCRIHQNFNKNHQNLNKTYAEPIRTSTKIHQNLNTIHAKFISMKHTKPEPPEHQNPSPLLQPAPECRSYGPESPCSLGRSHMSYILKRKRQRDIDINISKATNTQLHNISYKIFNLT